MPIRTVHQTGQLAIETYGAGVPVVFLHGLTFDRRTWRPIIDRLGDGVRSIAIDLPGHGDSPGAGDRLDRLAELIADALQCACGVTDPVIVGHSMSGALALVYAGTYTVRGVVTVDQAWNIQPFAGVVRQSAPALRGGSFSTAFGSFEQAIGIDRLAPAIRADVVARRRLHRDLVLSYWQELLDADPDEVQGRIEKHAASVTAPCLAVFGRELSVGERRRMRDLVPAVQVTEWAGDGHMVHLVAPDRFAARLRAFLSQCAPEAGGLR
jgi:pimeloyl-ACP methyl ester carboxylesterase